MLRVLSWLLCRCPAPLAAGVAWCCGWLLHSVLRLRRGVARENIARALPELGARARRRLLRQHYGHLGAVLVDTLRLPLLSAETARELLGDALARLESLRRDRGVIVLVGHLGCWDRLACAAALAGLPLSVVTREIKQGGVNRFWQRLRARFGVKLLPARGCAITLRRRLRAGELVALAIDQHQPGGVPTTFFGRPLLTSSTPARLARDSGARVVVASLTRCDKGFRLLFEALPEISEPLARTDELAAMTQRFNDRFEAHVRACPEQWFWVHRRWKGAPDPLASEKLDDRPLPPDLA